MGFIRIRIEDVVGRDWAGHGGTPLDGYLPGPPSRLIILEHPRASRVLHITYRLPYARNGIHDRGNRFKFMRFSA